MPKQDDVDAFVSELEELGEEGVSQQLALVVWGDGPKHWRWVQAKEYLDRVGRR